MAAIAKAYDSYTAAIVDGLSHIEAIEEAILLHDHEGITKENLSEFIRIQEMHEDDLK